MHLRAPRSLLRSSGAGAGPGPVQGAGALLTGGGDPTPSQRPVRRRWRQQGRQLRRPLPRFRARSRGGYQGCCCGWQRPPPPSPYRTRGPDGAWLSTPAITAPRGFPEGPRRESPPRTRSGRAGRKFAGRRRRSGGGGARREGAGNRPSRAAAAPLAPQSLTPRSPGASAAPHCPAIFSALHTRTPPPPSTTAAAAHGARPAAAEASARTARPAAAQSPQQAPPQAPPPAPRRPHPDSARHSSSVGLGSLRP